MGIQIPFMATDGDVGQQPPLSRVGSQLPRHRQPVLPFLLLGLVGWFLVYYATAWGPWAFSDAAGYITAARNLVAGHGIGTFKPDGEFSPTTSHPPLYVLTIGLVSQLGFEPLEAARVADVILFGLLVSASGLMVSRLLNRPWPGAAFSALLLLHPALIIAYTSAMAEPPFILLGFLSLLWVTMYSSGAPNSGLARGLAVRGRRFAVPVPWRGLRADRRSRPADLGGPSWAARLRRAIAFTAVGGTPVGIFVLWATSIPGAEGPRALSERLEVVPGLVRFVQGLRAALWSWKPLPPAVLLPDWLNGLAPSALVQAGLAAAIVLVLGWLGFQNSPSASRRTGAPGRIGGGAAIAARPGLVFRHLPGLLHRRLSGHRSHAGRLTLAPCSRCCPPCSRWSWSSPTSPCGPGETLDLSSLAGVHACWWRSPATA